MATVWVFHSQDADDFAHRKSTGKTKIGEKQRLLFALAICGNPSILFLDEPTVGMDITARKSLWAAIETLKAQGTSILLTTHYLEEADYLSDRIIMLKDGKIIREGSPSKIKSQINSKKIQG